MEQSVINLSACLEGSLKAVAELDEISSLDLAKRICEQHDSSGSTSPYADIRKIEDKNDAYIKTNPSQWHADLVNACSPEAKVLHTNLALLLLAKIDPVLAGDFIRGPDPSDTTPTIDFQLREDLYRLLADYSENHEIRGHSEFVELIDNVRKWRPKDKKMEGRRRTAVLYTADKDLTGWAQALNQLQGHDYYGLHFRLPVAEVANTLATAILGAFQTQVSDAELAPLNRYMSDAGVGEKFQNKMGKLLPSTPDLESLVLSFLKVLDQPGPRLILFIELEEAGVDETVAAAQELGNLFSGKEEDEGRLIVLIGGVPHGASLAHKSGAAVYRLETSPELEDTGQTWKNDLAKGKDLLNIKQEADALADGIASKELQPPLVVGICGGWGSGKSFVLHLIENHLKEIRSAPQTEDSLYVGHIYWIDFDAWYYSKQNIWASLMDRILSELERQVNIERILSRDNSQLPEDKAPWEITRELTDREIEKLTDDKAWTAHLHELEGNGEMRLLLDPLEGKLREDIDELEAELLKSEKQLEELQETKRQNKLQAGLQSQQQNQEKQAYQQQLEQLREAYIAEQLAPRLLDSAKNQFSDYLLERIGIKPDQFRELINQEDVRNTLVEKDVKRLIRIAQSSPTVWGLALVLISGIGGIIWGYIENEEWGLYAGIPAALYSAWSVVRTSFDQMLDGTKQALQQFNERYEANRQRVSLVKEELSDSFDSAIEKALTETNEQTDNEQTTLNKAEKIHKSIDAIIQQAKLEEEEITTSDGRTEQGLES